MSCFGEPAVKTKERPDAFVLIERASQVMRAVQYDLETTLTAAGVETDPVEKKKLLDKFRSDWPELIRFNKVYRKMETGAGTAEGLFAMLDRLDQGRAKAADLGNAHTAIAGLERAVNRSLGFFGSLKSLTSSFFIFVQENTEHLMKVAAVATSSLKKLSDAGTDMRDLMRTSVLAALSADERSFFVSYGARLLEKYPDGVPRDEDYMAKDRLRTFVHALQALADSAEEWERDHELIKAAISSDYPKLNLELDMSAFGLAAYPKGTAPAMKAGRFF